MCGDVSRRRFSAKWIDMQCVHAGRRRELGGQFSSEFDSAAVSDLPVGGLWSYPVSVDTVGLGGNRLF
jgi:hypothetical protein